MGRVQLEQLKKHGMYWSTPQGISMNPMLYQNDSIAEIHAITRPVRRYDVVLYIRGNEQGVIHRVLHFRNGVYIINGDNCWQKEIVQPSQIYGIVTRFYRHGVWHEVTEWKYRVYSHLWADLFFLRRPILYGRDRWNAWKRKRSQ